ncbi:MAG TPA: hypothetical protein VIK96_02300 [Bacilli bacterium]
MKSKKVIVPRKLVVETEPHPEPYGEAIVVLENGMWTDVYTDDDGNLFTITNDEELIAYLEANKD